MIDKNIFITAGVISVLFFISFLSYDTKLIDKKKSVVVEEGLAASWVPEESLSSHPLPNPHPAGSHETRGAAMHTPGHESKGERLQSRDEHSVLHHGRSVLLYQGAEVETFRCADSICKCNVLRIQLVPREKSNTRPE